MIKLAVGFLLLIVVVYLLMVLVIPWVFRFTDWYFDRVLEVKIFKRHTFYRYYNDRTVFNPYKNVAYANEKAAFQAGVEKDWSNVDVLAGNIPLNAFKGYKVIN
jgi:hypothetical protein